MTLQNIALYTHLTSLTLSVCAIAAADHFGFQWIRGKVSVLGRQTLHRLHWAVGVGLGLMIGSGSVLFWLDRSYFLSDTAFYVKMTFVLVLLINSFFIERLMHTATTTPFALLTPSKKIHLYMSGCISTACWFGAFTTAFFLS